MQANGGAKKFRLLPLTTKRNCSIKAYPPELRERPAGIPRRVFSCARHAQWPRHQSLMAKGNTHAVSKRPKRKPEPLQCELPPISKAADAVTAMGGIAAAVGTGEVAPAEAAALAKVVTGFVQALFTHGLDERLTRMEAAAERRSEPPKLPAPAPAAAAANADIPAFNTI